MPKSLIEAQDIHVVVEGTVVDPSYAEDVNADDSFAVCSSIECYLLLLVP